METALHFPLKHQSIEDFKHMGLFALAWHIMENTFDRWCCFMTQLSIENGEPLFSVDHVDPDFDDLCFEDNHVGDDDDDELIVLQQTSNQTLQQSVF